ncbi:hypothetical protein DFH09DRAFT_1310073 [Mycena vulgaris]|nr:hypothetical protein DFH09DRAFT_1310073 [Mycena vulgaris]
MSPATHFASPTLTTPQVLFTLFLKLVPLNSRRSMVNAPQTKSKLPCKIKSPCATRLPAQDQVSLCKIKAPCARSSLPVQDQGSARKDQASPRRIKAQGYLRKIFPVLIHPRTCHQDHLKTIQMRLQDAPRSTFRTKPQRRRMLVAVAVPHSSVLAAGMSSSVHITLFVADVSGPQAASAVRAHAAPKTTNFAARTSPPLLRRALTASLRSPPRCAALLTRNVLSMERAVMTNDEKDAAWWAAARATGTSGASPRACVCVGNVQRAHGLAILGDSGQGERGPGGAYTANRRKSENVQILFL